MVAAAGAMAVAAMTVPIMMMLAAMLVAAVVMADVMMQLLLFPLPELLITAYTGTFSKDVIMMDNICLISSIYVAQMQHD